MTLSSKRNLLKLAGWSTLAATAALVEIGRASCRERVCYAV